MIKLGLSLGGGSLRGIAHIGVLQQLEANKVPVHYLAGTSSGALIAGLYASGISPNDMIKLLKELEWRKYIDVKFSTMALLKGKKIYKDLVRLTEGKHFKDLDIPLSVVTIDLTEGCLKVISTGEVAKAIRASIAIPGIFHPVRYDNHIYVDGYILNNNPANIVRNMGADFVIASDVKSDKNNDPIKGVITSLKKYMNIASSEQTHRQLIKNADLIIRINCGKFGKLNMKSNEQFIKLVQEGRYQTEKELKKLIEYDILSNYTIVGG